MQAVFNPRNNICCIHPVANVLASWKRSLSCVHCKVHSCASTCALHQMFVLCADDQAKVPSEGFVQGFTFPAEATNTTIPTPEGSPEVKRLSYHVSGKLAALHTILQSTDASSQHSFCLAWTLKYTSQADRVSLSQLPASLQLLARLRC